MTRRTAVSLRAICVFLAALAVLPSGGNAAGEQSHAPSAQTEQQPTEKGQAAAPTGDALTLRAIVNDAPASTGLQALSVGDSLYIDFKAFIALFDFHIFIDSNLSNASGFFVSPEKKFVLNLGDGTLALGRGHKSVPNGSALKKDGRLFIEQKALSSWFDMAVSFDRAHGSVSFKTRFALPSQAKESRRVKREQAFKTAGLDPRTKISTEKRSFSGSTGAGYEVEIYRNNALVGFQYADPRGRYVFSDIPLLFGENAFRVLLYGPQGQFGEKNESFTVPPQSGGKSADTDNGEEKRKEKILKETQRAMTPPSTAKAQPARADNWLSLSVMRSEASLGAIEAYIGVRGVFLRLDSFLHHAGIAHDQRTRSSLLEIKDAAGKTIRLDLEKRVFMDTEGEHALYHNEAFEDDDKIYANTDLLYRLFPTLDFIVDQAQRRLNLPEPARKETATAEKGDLAPTPSAAPVIPVIIDEARQENPPEGQTLPAQPAQEAQDVLHLGQEPAPPPSPPKDSTEAAQEETRDVLHATKPAPAQDDASASKNGEPLVLEIKIKSMPASGSFIEALDFPQHVFLPLGDLLQIIDFPIKLDKDENKGSGFSFSQDNVFEIDLGAKEVRYGDKTAPLSENNVRRSDGRLYVAMDSFNEWFGLTCEIDRAHGYLHLKTDKLFPKEEEEKRRAQWNKLLSLTKKNDDDLPVLENPYRLAGYPSVDVTLGSFYNHSAAGTSGEDLTGSYNLQGAMDLAFMTSQFYAQGSSTEKTFQDARFQMGRKDPSANLLGPLRATEFSLGDVAAPSLSLVTGSALGRGGFLTNRAVTSSPNFDVHTLSGDSLPGHQVELYRNGVLVAFQTVDAAGRYNFADIPILYGKNTFRLVFYGPQGQTEERVETISASSAMLKKNALEYTFAAQERGERFLGIQKRETNEFPNALQLVGGLRYGLASFYTFGASIAQTRLEDGVHRYLATSSNADVLGVLGETNFAKDMKTGGWASSLSLLGGAGGVSLRGRYRRYHNFMSETVNSSGSGLRSEALIDANSQFYVPLLKSFTLGLSTMREEFVDDEQTPRLTQGVHFAKSLWGLSFSDKLSYVYDGTRFFQNTSGFQTRLWDINFRMDSVYDFAPVNRFEKASFAADYVLSERLSGQSQIEHNMSAKKTSFNQAINWDFDAFRLSLNEQVDSKKNYAFGMNVLFSLNHNPISGDWQMQSAQSAGGGAIAGRVFADGNSNGAYDDGEKMFTDATLRANHTSVKQDETGYFIAPIPPYAPAKVELGSGAVSDPLLTPKTNAYRVVTRPSDIVVADFPVVQTTIVDGTSYFLGKDGERKEVGNIVIELQDKEQKTLRRIMNEVDGYYSFDKVEKGDYWISVPDEVLSSLNAVLKEKIHVVIDNINAFITGKDIVLEQKADAPPASEGQTEPPSPQPAQPPAGQDSSNDEGNKNGPDNNAQTSFTP